MKPLILVALSVSMALTQMVNAEDQDQQKPPKNKHKPQQQGQYVAPRIAPRVQPNPPAGAVNPKVNRWQQPVNQPNVRMTPHAYPNPDAPRANQWQQNQVYHPNVPARVPMQPKEELQRPPGRTPNAVVTQPNAPARTQNWEHRRGNWQNHPYYNNWTQIQRRHERQYHHRDWWTNHYTRFALFGTGYYFWDNGYWFPAYGYDPAYNVYQYEEPIYGYGGLEPAQVIANVQTELQRLGYYPYAVDGTMGPMTRAAISNYQRDMGLAMTSAIDEPTLQSLGLE